MGRMASATLTNSEDGRRAILASEGRSAQRLEVIENGVDLARFADCRPVDIGRFETRIGAVANLRPVKNIDGLIRVAAALCPKYSRVKFEVVGDGELRGALQTQIAAAGLAQSFILHGGVSDIPAFLSRMDIAVLPSHTESMSNALLEYMAAGRAIVATDVGANSRLVCSGIEGLIVPPGNEDAMVAAIERYLLEPNFARTCSAAAREKVELDYSRHAMVRRFEEFFRSLMNSNGRRNFHLPPKTDLA